MSGLLERFGIIDARNIAAELASVSARSLPDPMQQLSALVRKGQMARAEGQFSHFVGKTAVSVAIFEEAAGFIAVDQELAVEATDHTVVADNVPGQLKASDKALYAQLEQAVVLA